MREKPEEKRWTAINVCWKLFVKSKIIILAQTLLLFSHELILYFKQQQQPNNNNNNKKLRLRLHSCVKWCIFFCNAFTGTEPKIYKSYNRRNEWTKKNTTNNIHTEIEKRNNPINNRRFLFIEKSTAIHWIACCSLHCYLFLLFMFATLLFSMYRAHFAHTNTTLSTPLNMNTILLEKMLWHWFHLTFAVHLHLIHFFLFLFRLAIDLLLNEFPSMRIWVGFYHSPSTRSFFRKYLPLCESVWFTISSTVSMKIANIHFHIHYSHFTS